MVRKYLNLYAKTYRGAYDQRKGVLPDCIREATPQAVALFGEAFQFLLRNEGKNLSCVTSI